MTNHHPLTDKIIDEELITRDECDRREGDGRANYYEEDFRTGADWQLEQVMKWLKETNYDYTYDAHEDLFDYMVEKIENLRKAMRPPVVVTLKSQILDVLNEDTMAMGSQLHRIRKLVDQMENNS
tara:strand:- start:636 stop:1010 length:375 start_codon:yes stop_codon:yes gene_type:complete